MAAGAVGFSGGRVREHLSSKGANVPGTFAGDEELLALAAAMGEAGHGVFQMIPLGANGDLMFGDGDIGPDGRRAEHEKLERIARASGRPVTYLLLQYRSDPDDWRSMLAASDASRAEGLDIVPQVGARGIGALTTLDGYHIFMLRRSYCEVAHLPLAERVEALRDPARRAAILAESSDPDIAARDPRLGAFIEMLTGRIANIYPMTLPLDYEPTEQKRLGALARQAGKSDEEFLYDHYTSGDGANVCASFQLNFPEGNLDATHDMLAHPTTSSGLADGGAHMCTACDAAIMTFQLSFWTRDRKRGARLGVEHMVRKLAARNAELYGFADRGRIAPGLRADINIIDYDRLDLLMPRMAFDLPKASPRLLQRSQGYLATMVNGVATRREDADTGARPGRLLRAGRG
jgi:N-acyl-D-aspartate/D-glutamate deacylase